LFNYIETEVHISFTYVHLDCLRVSQIFSILICKRIHIAFITPKNEKCILIAVFEIYPATGISNLEKTADSLSDKEGLPMTSLDQNSKIEITAEMLNRLLDYSSDEIFIFNNERQIIYANSICERNYGLKKEDLIGKLNTELFEQEYWYPSIYPEVYKKKKPMSIIQTTNTGAELFTSAFPVLNDKLDVELVITTAKSLADFNIHTYQEYAKYDVQELHQMIAQSTAFQHILDLAKKVAKTNATILIQGESGTGKGVLAQYIHQISQRKDRSLL